MPETQEEAKKTLGELAALYELEPSIREVIVEGSLDQGLVGWFLKRAGLDDVIVYRVGERVEVTPDDITKHGQTEGVRGELITAALFVAKDVNDAENLRSVTFIADRDWDWAEPSKKAESPLLLYTDYSAMELYAWSDQALDKLVHISLQCSRVLSGQQLRTILEPMLIAIYMTRLAVHRSKLGIGLPEKVETHVDLKKGELNRQAWMLGAGKGIAPHIPELCEKADEFCAKIPDDAREAIHGHDAARIIYQYVKPLLPKDPKKDIQNYKQLEKMWVMGVEHEDLAQTGLFIKLLDRVRAA